METDPFVIFDGKIHRKSEVRISPFQSGLYYGDGCFETIRSYAGKFLHLDEHLDRLHRAATYLNLDPVKINEEDLIALLNQNEILDRDAFIRIQLWREGERGYKRTDKDITRYVVEAKLLSLSSKPFKLITSETRVVSNRAQSKSFKLSNALYYSLAAEEAHQAGADGALMLNKDGFISETEIANVFWINNDQLFTPSSKCDAIPGVTQGIILNLFPQTIQGEYQMDDLLQANAIFISNSLREIVRVSSVNDVDFDINNPLLNRVREAFENYKTSHFK